MAGDIMPLLTGRHGERNRARDEPNPAAIARFRGFAYPDVRPIRTPLCRAILSTSNPAALTAFHGKAAFHHRIEPA
jgi:hypothetical protein